GDKSHSIFVAAEKLNESLSIKQTTLKGTLKLMPDGVLIYEITDRDLIEQMLSLRSKFRNINPKYNTANIIHITIGRISDKNILKDTPQSKEALADLLKLINNKIYKINKAAALSKIKTSFTIKGGFVSSTGDKDYLTTRFYPANESLVILKDIFKNAGKKINFIYTVIIAPIIEEVVFRVVPFTLTGMSVSNPASFIPALVTIFTGTFLFSAAHPLADKLTYSKDVRNIKNFIVPSLLLTSVYIATSVAFPEYGLFVSLISILLHAANNLVAYIKHIPQGMLNIFNIKESQNPEGNAFVNKWLLYLIQETEDLIKKEKSSSYYSQDEKTIEIYRECKKFFEDISSGNFSRQDDENVEDKLINIMQQLSKRSNNDVGSLLEGILIVSAYLRDSSGGVLFDKLHNFVMKQCTNGSSSRWQEILLWCAEAFYETNREYTYKIIDAFYENKKYIKSLLDYGRFALPLPSPAKFSSVADWENAIYEMMVKDSDIYPNWYSHELEIFIPSDIKKIDDYGKAFLRALYRSKKFTEPPYLRKIEHGYEWQKMFYNICGNDNGIYVFDESEPLIDRKTIKKFPYDPDILNTRNLYLSDIISSLNYLQKEVKPDYLFESSELSQILSALKDARSTSVQNQLKVVNAQINKLAELFIEKEDNISERNIRKTAEVLKLLIPILMFVKSDGSQKTLLNDILVKFKSVVSNFNSKYIADLDSIYSVIEELISIDKQEALDLLKALYANKYAKEFIFGRNWQQWQPVTVQDAYSFIPNKIQELLSYRDLELLYHNAGIDFDFIEEDSSLFDRTIYIPEYEELFLHLPETLSTQKKFPLKYFRTVKKEHLNKSADYDATHTASSVYFDALENILENNTLALSEMNKANRQSIEDSFSFVEEMIKNYSLLNKKNASAVQISLERIKESFYSSQMSVSDMMKLKKWSVNELDKIEELHTLINAIHQSSIENFMDILTIADGENKVIFKCDNVDMLSFFDCSSSGLDRQMQDFISSLSMRFADNSNFVVKDKKLVSSTRLGVHSVDILVDLEEGIRVTFNDSGRGDGNAMRVLLLATLFAQAGFDITNIDTKVENSLFSSENSYRGTCNFSARLSLPSGQLNNAQVYAKYFEQALTILSGTKNLDYTIENNDVDNETHRYFAFDIPQYDLDDFKLLKHTSDMPRGFNDIKTLKKEWEDRIAKIKSIDTQLLQENSSLAEVYDYLQIPQDRRNLWEIVNEYVKGKLVFNEDSVLEPNEQYGGFYPLLRAIKDDADLALKQAQLINLLNYDDLCYETQGYIGGMLVVSGIIRLDNYGWLSVKTAVDKERKRAKFAYVEYVDFRGNTRKIDYYELLQILQSSGYTVKEQKPRSRFEKQDSLRVLKEDIFPPKDGIYTRGLGVSSQTDGYVPVRITYDKNKIDENSMWIVSYTSPEDVAAIIKARAIMTTPGGMLSHANITARE
ncbi:MAG: CPBP family intramembrane metalloprotease, partial [Elusimicrobia bacterium]|nr:CPBP family intramembrane metalloprotease [Elusimicrobiota bacterium]